MIEILEKQVNDLVHSSKPKLAIDLCEKVINHCVLILSGLYSHYGEEEKAYNVLRNGVPFATDCNVHNNLSSLLIQNGNSKEAVELLESLTSDTSSINPNADTYYNLGIALKNCNQLSEALDALEKSLELNPDSPATHCLIADICVAQGQYARFFEEDWHRFALFPKLKKMIKELGKPFWDGTPGRTVLVFNDQGNGDFIQFARWVKHLKEVGCRVTLKVEQDMFDLFKSLEGYDCICSKILDNYDCIVPVTSLPAYFDPNLDDIPMKDYYLQPEGCPELLVDVLRVKQDKKKIGICWAGSLHHTSDPQRSCYLKHFKPLFDLDAVIVSLQKGNNVRDWGETVNLLEDTEDLKYVDAAPFMTDYNKTALILKQLDVLVTVDTSVAHLAGAIGIPVWLLIPYAHEWRWKKTWYPSMQVLRQTTPGNWDNLLNEVACKIRETNGIRS